LQTSPMKPFGSSRSCFTWIPPTILVTELQTGSLNKSNKSRSSTLSCCVQETY
jgi:hypothetical protein